MIGSVMTILMGMYEVDHSDVAIISDRRATPNAIGRAIGAKNRELMHKTIRLGPQVAIGFAGATPLANFILAALLGIRAPAMEDDLLTELVTKEDGYSLSFDDVKRGLNDVTGRVIKQVSPPQKIGITVMVAGMSENETPLLGELHAETRWRAELVLHASYCAPFAADDELIKAEFESFVSAPGLDYVASLKAAVQFCADRYGTISRDYVLRRLRTGFAREEGHV